MPVVAKVIGGDYELANFLAKPGEFDGRVDKAAKLLLDEIAGFPAQSWSHGSSIEFARRFLPGSGGSAYIDNDHLEINTPEHLNSREHALHIHAGFRIARQAQMAVNDRLPQHTRLAVLANNCDGRVSYGSHLNVMTTRRCFEDLTHFKPRLAAFLATHLVTSVIYTGQGMVGAANGQPACNFQFSQRADWFERLNSLDTMVRRPLVNNRDESHAHEGLARLHVIYLDCALQPVANWLRAGTTQLVTAICEAGWVDPTLSLDDPVLAASPISRDLQLSQPFSTTVRGRRLTALEIQQAILNLAGELVAAGEVDHAVPEAPEILRVWQETLDMLRARDVVALAARCDNWLKFLLLDRRRFRHGLTWQSSDLKALDLRYGSLDPADGLFFQMARADAVEQMPTDAEIERCAAEPPNDTRAHLRAHVLRRWGGAVSHMDWSWIDFNVQSERGWWSVARLPMVDPLCLNASEITTLLADCRSLDDLLAAVAQESPGAATRDRRMAEQDPAGSRRHLDNGHWR
jgi:proteasome accessory factor A